MDSRSTPFYLSFPVGTWFQTQVRVSLLFLFVLIYCLLEHPPAVGATIFGLLFVSVLIHEFGHVFAARWSGGEGEDILMWPLGGLAYVRPANTTSSELLTHGAGPFTNAILCGACLAGLKLGYERAFPAGTFSLLTLPRVNWQTDIGADVLALAASINFKLLCVNLLPALPLDGGQMAFAIARTQGDAPDMRQLVLRLGMFVSIGLVLFGWLADDTSPIVLAFFVGIINLQEPFILALSDHWSEGFAGAEFSSSLRDEDQEPRPGMIARWRMRRAEERQQREAEERIQTERKVDELLDKVHREGMNSLTDAEKRFLTRASEKYRSQEH
jgi:stage IV sporulation protein FB